MTSGDGQAIVPVFFKRPNSIVELTLVTPVCIDLPRIASHHDAVELFQDVEELVMVLMPILQNLATHARFNEAVRDRDGVETVAVRQLVTAPVGDGARLDFNHGCFEL